MQETCVYFVLPRVFGGITVNKAFCLGGQLPQTKYSSNICLVDIELGQRDLNYFFKL